MNQIHGMANSCYQPERAKSEGIFSPSHKTQADSETTGFRP